MSLPNIFICPKSRPGTYGCQQRSSDTTKLSYRQVLGIKSQTSARAESALEPCNIAHTPSMSEFFFMSCLLPANLEVFVSLVYGKKPKLNSGT